MSYETIRSDWETLFNSNFPTFEPDVKISWDNVEFKPPTNSEWVHLGISYGANRKQCIGLNLYRYWTNVYAQIFVPLNSGSYVLDRITSNVVKTFRLMGSPYLLEDVTVTTEGSNDGFYQQIANIIAIRDFIE